MKNLRLMDIKKTQESRLSEEVVDCSDDVSFHFVRGDDFVNFNKK